MLTKNKKMHTPFLVSKAGVFSCFHKKKHFEQYAVSPHEGITSIELFEILPILGSHNKHCIVPEYLHNVDHVRPMGQFWISQFPRKFPW